MKRLLLTSLVLVLISALLFAPVYGLLIYTVNNNAVDYSGEVGGSWKVFQYYKGNERVVCNEEVYMNLTLTEDTILVEGTVLPEVDTSYTWNNGTSFSYECEGSTMTFFLSFDTNNNLKITTSDSEYILLLRRQEG